MTSAAEDAPGVDPGIDDDPEDGASSSGPGSSGPGSSGAGATGSGSWGSGAPGYWALGPDDRDQLAGRVFALVLDDQLRAFSSLESAVRSDSDIEALHAYRVSLRRSRSLLAAGVQVYPAEELELLKALTTQFAAYTSPVRDFDVLLDGLDERADQLTPNLRSGIGELSAELLMRRGEAFETLLEVISGDLHDVMIRRWQTMATVYRVGGSGPGPAAMRPTGDVVDDIIANEYRRVRKLGARASRSDDPAGWHKVRRRLKRLRYLLVMFAPLYPEAAFDPVVKELKRLQNRLGRLQDSVAYTELIQDAGIAAGGRGALTAGALAEIGFRDAEAQVERCRSAWSDLDPKGLRRQLDEVTSR